VKRSIGVAAPPTSIALRSIQKKAIRSSGPVASTPTDFVKIFIKNIPQVNGEGLLLPIQDQMIHFQRAIREMQLMEGSIYFVSFVNPYVIEVFLDKSKQKEVLDILNKNNVNIIKSFDPTVIKSQDSAKIKATKKSMARRIAYICIKTKNEAFHKFVRQGFDQDVLDESTTWMEHFRELHRKKAD